MPAFTGRIKTGFDNIRYQKNASAQFLADPVDTTAPVYEKSLTSGDSAQITFDANGMFRIT